MSTDALLRYRKPGGFKQLVSLIETFGPQKKEKFLEMIDAEGPAWGEALRAKMLTIDRIFKWPDDTVERVFKRLPTKSLAYVLDSMKPEQKAKIATKFSQADIRRLEDVMSQNSPKPEEVASVWVKVIEYARQMLIEGELHADKMNDPELAIPADIETLLESHVSVAGGAGSKTSPSLGSEIPAEVLSLQRKFNAVLAENKALKDEIQTLKSKLEQIRIIA